MCAKYLSVCVCLVVALVETYDTNRPVWWVGAIARTNNGPWHMPPTHIIVKCSKTHSLVCNEPICSWGTKHTHTHMAMTHGTGRYVKCQKSFRQGFLLAAQSKSKSSSGFELEKNEWLGGRGRACMLERAKWRYCVQLEKWPSLSLWFRYEAHPKR